MGRASLAALAGGAEVDEAGGMEKGLLKVAIDRWIDGGWADGWVAVMQAGVLDPGGTPRSD